ncbi:MAG: GntR family transcriptional regulator [Verrucomicrobiaceae bacterium]|nr:MAG: GntR family transcriptional regulator [Verrucomicrobiaceae bacterium]
MVIDGGVYARPVVGCEVHENCGRHSRCPARYHAICRVMRNHRSHLPNPTTRSAVRGFPATVDPNSFTPSGGNGSILAMPIDRQPLLDQVTASLLADLSAGAYPERLPSERELAARLKVSRPVIRAALKLLENQGWVRTEDRSKSRRVLKRPDTPPGAVVRRVGILISRTLLELSSDDIHALNEITNRCEKEGWKCFVYPVDQLDPRNLERRLDEIVSTPTCDLWIVFPNRYTQVLSLLHQKGHKVIGMSTSEKGAGYGVIHYDTYSARIHALGVMLRAGRRNVIMPLISRRPVEISNRTGKLLEEFGVRYREDFHTPVYDTSREAFIRILENSFASSPRPDGIIVQYTTEVQAVLLQGWLMKARLSFPEDLSVIQIGSDSFIDLMHGKLSHYPTPPGPLVEGTFNAIRHYFTTGELLTGRLKLTAEYVKGDSV